jgi:DNA-binding MarR family transcriptional regulator
MDTVSGLSAAEVARRLGTTVPRVKRAIDRMGLPVERGAGGRVRIDPPQLARLRRELGARTPVDGLTRVQVAILAALARAPLGLVSVRAVARRACVSPTAASEAIDALAERGLIVREPARVAAGRARDVELLHPAWERREWRRLAPALAAVEPPRQGSEPAHVVPDRLRHLFWNTAPTQLDVRGAGGYIAKRLLEVADLEGLAWGAEHLDAADWERAARARGLDARSRRLARNIAQAGRERADAA